MIAHQNAPVAPASLSTALPPTVRLKLVKRRLSGPQNHGGALECHHMYGKFDVGDELAWFVAQWHCEPLEPTVKTVNEDEWGWGWQYKCEWGWMRMNEDEWRWMRMNEDEDEWGCKYCNICVELCVNEDVCDDKKCSISGYQRYIVLYVCYKCSSIIVYRGAYKCYIVFYVCYRFSYRVVYTCL